MESQYSLADCASHQHNTISNQGFVLFKGLLDREEVDKTKHEIDLLTRQHWDFEGIVDHFKCVFNRSTYWIQFLDWPYIIELVEESLGCDCHIIGQTAWRSHPGSRGVGLHTDHIMCQLPEEAVQNELVLPPMILTAHFYLSDITHELCPTKVIPGSHRSGRSPRQDETKWNGTGPVPILCEAGDVVVFRSDLWHSGSDNLTVNQTRYMLQVHYGRRMVAQKFSPYLAWRFNPKVIAACSPRQRRLLGDHVRGAYD